MFPGLEMDGCRSGRRELRIDLKPAADIRVFASRLCQPREHLLRACRQRGRKMRVLGDLPVKDRGIKKGLSHQRELQINIREFGEVPGIHKIGQEFFRPVQAFTEQELAPASRGGVEQQHPKRRAV